MVTKCRTSIICFELQLRDSPKERRQTRANCTEVTTNSTLPSPSHTSCALPDIMASIESPLNAVISVLHAIDEILNLMDRLTSTPRTRKIT